jgi:eukaryotic-like serine/threonine-protein kinase
MRFLIIDDDADYKKVLRYHLEVEWPDAIVDDYCPLDSANLPESYHIRDYDLILLGYPLGNERSLAWLRALHRRVDCPPIVLFADPSDELLAVDALKAGASSYFPKAGVTHQRLIQVLREEMGAVRIPPLKLPLIGREGSTTYRLTRTLHSTEVASVYLAESSDALEKLAFKVIRYTSDSGGEKVFGRFLVEYEVIATLEHPNVVRIHDLGVADDHAYIAMEYLSAGTLAERLSSPLNPERALAYLKQMAAALEAVHGAGVLHRDLKPSNIMFRKDDSLAIIDFGLAKRMHLEAALTGAGQIFGTPYYMSPEQGHADPTDERSDLYSLGCIFYEMLTGRRPFVGSSALGVIYKHAHAERPKLDNGERLQGTIEKMMAIRPEDRYQSARQLLDALEELSP